MRAFTIFGIIFGCVGIGFLIGACFMVQDYLYYREHAVSSVGTVARIETRSDDTKQTGSSVSTTSDYAIITFYTQAGQKYELDKLVPVDLEMKAGDEFSLHYLPEDPLLATLDDSFWDHHWYLWFFFFGFGFTVGGFFMIRQGMLDNLNERRARNYTESITATVHKVKELAHNPKAKPEYYIVAEGIHPRTGKKMVFNSRKLKHDPTNHLSSTVTVKLHPTKDQVYWLVTDGLT